MQNGDTLDILVKLRRGAKTARRIDFLRPHTVTPEPVPFASGTVTLSKKRQADAGWAAVDRMQTRWGYRIFRCRLRWR